VNSWNEDSVENFIPRSAGFEMKNSDELSALKGYRRIKKETAATSYSKRLQKGDGASLIGDSRKRRSEFGLIQDTDGIEEVMKNASKTEGAADSNAKVLSQKSSISETEVSPDQPERDIALNTESSILETPSDQSAKEGNELNVPNSMLSMSQETSVPKTAELPKDPSLVLDYKNSDKIHEDLPKLMKAVSKMNNIDNNAMSEPLKSSVDTDGIDIPQTDDESQKMLKIRGVEGVAASRTLIPENNMLGLQVVENEDPLAEVYGRNLHSTIGNMGFGTGLPSDMDSRQGIEDKITNHMTDIQWKNFNKKENSGNMPDHNLEAFIKQLRSYINSQTPEFWQNSLEQKAPMSLENFNSGVMPRYVSQDQPSYYYAQNADDVENLKDPWNGRNQMCIVPCWHRSYVVQPHPYALYVTGSDQNYVTGVQVPQVTLPSAYLPPMQFPDTHSGATAFSSVAIAGHGDHANANQNAHKENYAVTSNAYGGTSQGSHIYGGSSHSYVKEPLKHLEYSLTTPQKVLHTSLILKAPLLPAVHPLHPNHYVHPYIHVAEQKNINLQK
jgi:hypothetical protein